jgi:hypothetical protein
MTSIQIQIRVCDRQVRFGARTGPRSSWDVRSRSHYSIVQGCEVDKVFLPITIVVKEGQATSLLHDSDRRKTLGTTYRPELKIHVSQQLPRFTYKPTSQT